MDKSKLKSNIDKTKINIDKTNPLPEFLTPTFFYPVLLIIIILIILLIIIYTSFNITKGVPLSKSQSTVASEIIMIVVFVIIILITCISLVPNLKNLKQLFQQIGNVTYAIIYTIFTILFFTLTPSEVVNKYYYLIVPLILFVGALVFYKSIQTSYVDKFNINYERIKSVILFFCILTIMIIYYNVDPGGLVQKYFGQLMLLTIIISVFVFLYLIIVLTLPDTTTNKTDNIHSNFLNHFSNFSVYGTIFFVIFLIIITIIISTYPGGFFSKDNKVKASAMMIFTLLICILWSILIISNMFPEITDKKITLDKLNLFKRGLLILFGLIISILIIVWIIYALQDKSGKSGTISLVVNILLILLLVGIIYKTIYVKTPTNNNDSKENFMMKIILYISSALPNIYHYLIKQGVNKDTTENNYWYMLILAILLLTIYFYYPTIYNKFILQGGKLLINQPIYTNTEVSIGTYQTLNGSDTYDYNYALSFWIFLNSFPPNTNTSYTKYTSLLSYGGKPNILYNASENTLLITMKQEGLEEQKGIEDNTFIEFDENGNRILYKNTNMLLQKWIHIVLNYHGGILDIFLNGELVKSVTNVIQYYTLDSLTVGENNGFNGGISSIVYYHKNLTKTDIHFIYNTLKNEENPVTKKDDNTTIMKLL